MTWWHALNLLTLLTAIGLAIQRMRFAAIVCTTIGVVSIGVKEWWLTALFILILFVAVTPRKEPT